MIKGGTIVQKTVSVLVNPVEQRQEGKLLGDNTSESQDASQADDEEQQARYCMLVHVHIRVYCSRDPCRNANILKPFAQ